MVLFSTSDVVKTRTLMSTVKVEDAVGSIQSVLVGVRVMRETYTAWQERCAVVKSMIRSTQESLDAVPIYLLLH